MRAAPGPGSALPTSSDGKELLLRVSRGIAWPVGLGLLGIVILFAATVVAQPAALPERTPATPALALVAATATSEPSPIPAPTFTPLPTQTPLPAATSTATPAPTVEPTRAQPASRGMAARPTEVVAPTPVPPPPPPPTRTPVPAPPPAPAVSGEIAYSLRLLNEARAAGGLPGLALDARISEAARLHAEDMGRGDYLAHVNRQGLQPWDRMRAAGAQFGWAAENLGRAWGPSGSAEPPIKQMHDMMMAEVPPNDGHRVNVLSPRAKRVGIGIARVNGWVYWVCDFAD